MGVRGYLNILHRSPIRSSQIVIVAFLGLLSISRPALSLDIPECGYHPDWLIFQKGATVFEHYSTESTSPAPGTHDGYRVVLPDVTVAFKQYDQIHFARGDAIVIDACGCVQTGGKGLTWKRYVDPQGDNSEKYYHGGIVINGALEVTGVPLRRWSSNGQVFNYVRINDLIAAQIKNNGSVLRATNSSSLVLGYEDDHYDDNGYWGHDHDDGTSGQCAGIGGAVVQISIYHH